MIFNPYCTYGKIITPNYFSVFHKNITFVDSLIKNFNNMKKHLLFLTALLLGFQMVFAQDTPKDKKGLKLINFTIGPSFSNIISNKDSHKVYDIDIFSNYERVISDYKTDIIKDIKTGIAISTGFEYYIKNNLSLNFALSYNEKGIDLNYKKNSTYKKLDFTSHQNFHYTMDISYRYLTLPISVRRYFKNDKFYIQGGIYTGYLLSLDAKTHVKNRSWFNEEPANQLERKCHYKDKTNTKNFDFGVSLGAGFSQKLSENLFFNTSILFNLGLVDVDKKFEKRVYSPLVNPQPQQRRYYGNLTNVKNISCTVNIGVSYQL